MHYFRRVIRIRAEDSPNVKRGLEQLRRGERPDNMVVTPGVLTYQEYVKRRATWDPVRACVGLDGAFYEGAEILLYPPEWLNRAEQIAESLRGKVRVAQAMGVDPAEGGDATVWTVVDKYGLIYLESMKTADTSVIANRTAALIREYRVPHERVMFDRGGGGKQHADLMEARGFKGVKSVGFGETVTLDPKRGLRQLSEKIDVREERYAYVNRRAEMYGLLSILLNPVNEGWGIPAQYAELRRQLAPIPRWEDGEGRLFLPPKNRKPGEKDDKVTMRELIGCSPDEADSLVLAIYGMTQKPRIVAGAMK